MDHKAGPDSAFIVGRYQISRCTPQRLADWPTDAVLEVRYDLADSRVTMTVTVSNPTALDLPYGFGIHPYFRLPFAPGGMAEQTQVVLPASKYWVLDHFLPTGEIHDVDARLDFRQGQPRAGLRLDDVLTDLEYGNDRGVCRLVDLAKKAELRLEFDRSVRELVVYTPHARDDVISVEPYTQATDAINLEARGVAAGLRILGHGAHDTFVIAMETHG